MCHSSKNKKRTAGVANKIEFQINGDYLIVDQIIGLFVQKVVKFPITFETLLRSEQRLLFSQHRPLLDLMVSLI